MNEEFDDITWDEIFFDGDIFVEEQRGTERHGARVEVAFAYQSQRYRALSTDISDGGLFIATSQILPADAKFKLVFKLPTCEEPIRAIGRVAWIRTEFGEGPDEVVGFGVQFVKISEEARRHIDHFLELREALLMEDASES